MTQVLSSHLWPVGAVLDSTDLRDLLLTMWSKGQHQCHLGALEKCRISGPTPDSLNRNLHLALSQGILCTLNFEKLC